MGPINTIPNELLARVFGHYVDETRELPAYRLMLVSRRWKIIAESTPSLWSIIETTGSNERRIRGQLDRAGCTPLHIRVLDVQSLDLSDLFLRDPRRLVSLHLAGPAQYILPFIQKMSTLRFENLATLAMNNETMGPDEVELPTSHWIFPPALLTEGLPSVRDFGLQGINGQFKSLNSLTTLSLTGWHTPRDGGVILLEDLVDALLACPGLEGLHILRAIMPGSAPAASVALPHLKQLSLYEYSGRFTSLLTRLSFPSTTTTVICPMLAETGTMLTRALRPLQNHIAAAARSDAARPRRLMLNIDPLQGGHFDPQSPADFMVMVCGKTHFPPVAVCRGDAQMLLEADPSTEGIQTQMLRALFSVANGLFAPYANHITHLDLRLARVPDLELVFEALLGRSLQEVAMTAGQYGSGACRALVGVLSKKRFRNPFALAPGGVERIVVEVAMPRPENAESRLDSEQQRAFVKCMVDLLRAVRGVESKTLRELVVQRVGREWDEQQLEEYRQLWTPAEELVKLFVWTMAPMNGCD